MHFIVASNILDFSPRQEIHLSNTHLYFHRNLLFEVYRYTAVNSERQRDTFLSPDKFVFLHSASLGVSQGRQRATIGV
jgi:hypothetical protein